MFFKWFSSSTPHFFMPYGYCLAVFGSNLAAYGIIDGRNGIFRRRKTVLARVWGRYSCIGNDGDDAFIHRVQ